jgi:hypothetical protein
MIIYYLYSHNGLYNQFYSWQLLAGLSKHFQDQEIHVINNLYEDKIQNPQRDLVAIDSINQKIQNDKKFGIADILDFDLKNIVWHENDYFISNRLNSNIINMQEKYLNVSGAQKNEGSFAQGRMPLWIDPSKNNIFTQSLIPYSKFFFNRTKDIDLAIHSLKFHKEYFDLAHKIADHLGSFNSAHTRVMTDHFQYYMFDQEKLSHGLRSFNNNSLPIYLSVDDINSDLLKQIKIPHTYIHDIILNDFYTDFNNLTFANNITVGLLSSLVCSLSEDFVGTPYSTFTNFIHQERSRNEKPSFKYFDGTQFSMYNEKTLPYSWESIPGTFSWERDWKECKLNV